MLSEGGSCGAAGHANDRFSNARDANGRRKHLLRKILWTESKREAYSWAESKIYNIDGTEIAEHKTDSLS